MEAIENVIDEWLITQFSGAMGSSSSYTTLKLKQIDTAILRTPKDWEAWIFPALGVSNRFVTRHPEGHMLSTEIAISKRITYLLTFVTYGTESTAIQTSRTLLARAEIALNAMRQAMGSLSNDYEEKVEKLTYYSTSEAPDAGSSRMRKYVDPTTSGKWFVAQDISVVFVTATGV